MALALFQKIGIEGPRLTKKYPEYLHKVLVKERVSSTVRTARLVRTLELPEDFTVKDMNPTHILKAVRGSGFVFDLANASSVNSVQETMRKWRRTLLERRLPCGFLIEEKINDAVFGFTGEAVDYKFFCFHGEPKYFLVRSKGNRNFYWLDYTPMKAVKNELPTIDLTEMLRIAKTLSAPFEFVRIDLYNSVDGAVFGEYTFHVTAGQQEFSLELEYKLGKLW